MRGFKVIEKYKDSNVILPERKTENAAGYDISSLYDYCIRPGKVVMIETGLKAYMEPDEVLQIYPRSSLYVKKGLTLTNNVGIIDADYYENPDNDGHIILSVKNISDRIVNVKSGERLAQGIFMKFLVTDDDVKGGKRVGGFGSTK